MLRHTMTEIVNKMKVQGVPLSLPEEEEADKTKQAQIEQTYENH